MAVNLSALAGAGQQFFDNSGNVLTGGKLYSYQAGTTTPQTTYTDATGTIAHSNPIILNASGRVSTGEIWLTAGNNYKFVLNTSDNVLIATWDNITGINGTGITSSASSVSFTGFKGQTGNVQDLADDDGSNWIGFDQAGTGAVAQSVQDKLQQTLNVKDFGVVGDGVVNDTSTYLNYLETVESQLGNFSNLTDTSLYASYYQFNRKRGNVNATSPQYAYRFPYSLVSTPSGSVNTYITSITNVAVESGNFLLRIRFKGFINRISLQFYDSGFLAQSVTNLCGATQPFPGRTAYSGDNIEKTVVVSFPRSFGGYNFADGTVRGIRVNLNTNVTEQDSTFELIALDYSWVNDKNIYVTQPKLDCGFKGIAVRNWNNGVDDDGAFFMESDEDTKFFIDTIRRITQRQNDLDWVRFPIQYKYLYNGGLIAVERVRRVLTVLDYLSSVGLNAIVTMNHGFTNVNFAPDRWIQPDDVATPALRTSTANAGATIATYIVNHPAVVAIELENEINGYLIGTTSATGVFCDSTQAYDYIVKLSTALRQVTSKPLVQSYSGGLSYTQCLWSDLSSYVDVININQYGAARTFLPDTTLPLTAFESEGSNVNDSRGFTQIAGVWSSYVDPFYTGSSYSAINLSTYNQYRPPALGVRSRLWSGDLTPYNGLVGYNTASLTPITNPQNRELVYLTSINDYYQWNDGTGSWALKGW